MTNTENQTTVGPLRILHTSDWHLGHTLYGYDRTEEQQSMIDQLVEIVATRTPDVLLVSGDIYHTSQPSAAVQTMYTRAIVRLHAACPTMTIIVTAGNHDSGSRHEIFKEPWQTLNVFAVGTVCKDRPEEHIIEIKGKGYIVAMPYCHERNLPDGFFQGLLDTVAERNQEQQLPVLMMAHTTVSGCDSHGHDHATDYTVGGIDSIDLKDFGEGYDYLALGHIHHGQWVKGGDGRVRYSGTPIPVSFDENYEHSITMISLTKHGEKPSAVELIPIGNPHPLVTLPTDGFGTWKETLKLLESFPSDHPAYIRLNVLFDETLPTDANAIARKTCEGKQCRFCLINAKRPTATQSATKTLTVQELQQQNPIDIARQYAEDTGAIFDDDMILLFNEALKQTHETA